MYTPKAFREDDREKLYALMQEYSFAVLVTSQQDGTPLATHLPFMLDTERGPYGTLRAHMARANPQWQAFDGTCEVLVIFQGPHAYISPSWYGEKLSVPTWNYTAVHAYGKPRVIEDTAELYSSLQDLIQRSESGFEKPWMFDSLPDDYVQNLMRGTVGFEMEITRLEGKFKISQNRPEGDQIRVAATLHASSNTLGVGIADLMDQRRKA